MERKRKNVGHRGSWLGPQIGHILFFISLIISWPIQATAFDRQSVMEQFNSSHSTKLLHALSIDAKLEKSLKPQVIEMKDRILEAAMNVPENKIPEKNFTDPSEAYHTIMRSMGKSSEAELRELLFHQAMFNSGITYLTLRSRYDPTYNPVKDSHKLAIRICITKCPVSILKSLSKDFNTYALSIQNSKQVSMPELTGILNKAGGNLNKLLNDIRIRTKGGLLKTPVYDSSDANFDDEFTKEAYNKYLHAYIKFASQPDGLLLFTEVLREKFGEVKCPLSKDLRQETHYADETKFRYRTHKKITEEDAQAAVDEALWRILDGAKSWREMYHDADFGLDNLIRYNPVAVGQVLIIHPLYTGHVSSALNVNFVLDLIRKDRDKNILWGGIFVGTAISLTGIGAGLGSWLIAGAVGTAELSAGTIAVYSTLQATATATSIAGATLSAGQAGYHGARMQEHKYDFDNHTAALLSQSSDFKGSEEARTAMKKFKAARGLMLVNLTFLALDQTLLKGAYALLQTTESITAMTLIYRTALDSEMAMNLKALVPLLGSGGGKKLELFFAHVARMKEKQRHLILQYMASKDFVPQKMHQLIEEVLRPIR